MSEFDMTTYEGRKAYVQFLAEEMGRGLISLKEYFKHVYHWTMYEYYLSKKANYHVRCDKQRKWLNDASAVYAFRKEMADHL